nr:head GIN domain-containing protein [uncultured Sphingomonas sp.]
MRRFAVILATALLTGGCHVGSEAKDRDAGAQTSRTYQVGSFDKVETAGAFDIKIVTGNTASVTATGGTNLLDETEVIVEDGELKIRPKKHNGVRWNWSGAKAVFTVTTPALRSLTLAGAGDADIDKVGGDFEGTLAGAGSLRMASVDVGNLKLNIAGSGDVSGAGKASNIDLSIAGSGNVDAAQLTAKTADISIAGSGDIKANVSDQAKVSIMGSGDVEISGGAKCDVSKFGGGEVRCN